MIYILSENIRTGKTTALLNWTKTQKDCDGILCPDDAFGKRYFLQIKTKKEVEFEVETDGGTIIKIGTFRFLKSAFQKANDYLIASAEKRDCHYLIIDELGKLELKNQGLHFSALKLIPKYAYDKKHHLILVVRASLLNEIIKHYNISQYSVIKKEALEQINY
ncbi:MAG: nucleoside-triphosphatase [Gelidibacter sp.]|nr:hypothetical protein [Gelidibacter sp.]